MQGNKSSRRTNPARATIQWLRQVAPPGWTIGLVVAFVAILQVVVCIAASFEGWELASRMHRVRDGLLIAAAGVYGLYRALGSHPLFHKEYCEFLARTPWDRRHPLPLSPIILVPQDAILLGLLLLPFAFRPDLSPVLVPLVFLTTHLLVLVLALLLTGEPWFAWFVALGLALSIRLTWVGPCPQLVVLVLTYPIAWWGVWQSLAALPWDDLIRDHSTWQREFFETQQRALSSDKSRREVDITQFWPWKALAFTAPERLVDFWQAWAWSALAGFYLYAIISLVPIPNDSWAAAEYYSKTGLFVAMAGVVAAIIRYAVYTGGCRNLLSTWSRIRLKQYVIPAYDLVGLTPLVVVCLAFGLYPLLTWLGAPLAIGVGVSAFILLGTALTGGPRRRNWQLTSPARLVPSIAPQGETEAI
jgi:hypothetical protein